MKKKTFILAVGLLFGLGMVLSACADPRKNCNHPDHGKYMSEKINRKNKF